jgi:predicted transcriptional regulator
MADVVRTQTGQKFVNDKRRSTNPVEMEQAVKKLNEKMLMHVNVISMIYGYEYQEWL